MGMQTLRFRKGLGDKTEGDAGSRPPAALTFGICLLVGAAIIVIVLAAVRFGIIDAVRQLLQ